LVKTFKEKLELIVKKINETKFWISLKENFHLFSIFNWNENTIWIVVLFVISLFLTFIFLVLDLIEEYMKQKIIMKKFTKIYFTSLVLFIVSKILFFLRLKIREIIEARGAGRIEPIL
jgi:hypothetical protein